MSTEKIIDSLFDNNLEQFRNEVRAALFVKTGEYMQTAKQELASSMMNGNSEDVQEAKELVGDQYRLDANENGRIDAGDFPLLRKTKTKRVNR